MYAIRYQANVNLLDVTWTGLFRASDMTDYARDCRACRTSAGFTDGFRLRIVLSDDQPLPQEALAVLASAFDDFPKPSRLAWVTASSIARLQIKRAMMWPYTRIFETPEAAMEWLIEP